MRSALLGLLLVASLGCGGNVVVDAKTTGGAGGEGGTASTTGTGSITNSTAGCISTTCSGASDGSCSCDAICGQQTIAAFCSGGTCACTENGILIAKCPGSGTNACDLFDGCCADAFAWQ
jgi:hypothetical protein